MAWISVHDHVVGGKLRELSKQIGCSQKEALGILISLWLWGINNADKSGEIKSADREDVADALSTGLSIGLDPMHIVNSLIATRWLDEVDGTLYLHDWDQWQEQWFKFLSQKEYDARRKREERARKRQEEKQKLERASDNPSDSPPDSPPDNARKEENPPEKPKKAKVEKTKYADYVSMKPEEYQKLVDAYGEPFTKACIQKLDFYKGSKGKTYKDDYRAILSWVVDEIKKTNPGLIQQASKPETQNGGNPFAKYKRGGDNDGS